MEDIIEFIVEIVLEALMAMLQSEKYHILFVQPYIF